MLCFPHHEDLQLSLLKPETGIAGGEILCASGCHVVIYIRTDQFAGWIVMHHCFYSVFSLACADHFSEVAFVP